MARNSFCGEYATTLVVTTTIIVVTSMVVVIIAVLEGLRKMPVTPELLEIELLEGEGSCS
jgi:hypothetical protein